jgi:hypothetical protein
VKQPYDTVKVMLVQTDGRMTIALGETQFCILLPKYAAERPIAQLTLDVQVFLA